jgi:DNA/RNA endonuclease YhcR with UshA esterase domain
VRKLNLTVPHLAARSGRAAAVLVSVLFAVGCAGDVAPPFELEGSGDIEGRVFFDANGDGEYTPAAGDQPVADHRVELRERGTQQVMQDVVTDDRGRFAFESVRPGTHDIYLDTVGLADMTICRNPLPASVYVSERQYVPVPTAEGCVITIATAKTLQIGDFVMVEGVTTVGQGRHRNDNIYLQDLTTGIQVFGIPSTLGLIEGDSVRVTGELGQFNDELQIVNPNVTLLGEGTVPEPRVVTGAEINALTYVGELVRAESATLLEVGSEDGLGRHNVTLQAEDGESFQVRIEGGAVDAMPASAWVVGATYDITGALGSFRGTAQIKPRVAADIERVE